jgi:hypothetical protein
MTTTPTPTPSPTPRTDAAWKNYENMVVFARTLETELASANKLLEASLDALSELDSIKQHVIPSYSIKLAAAQDEIARLKAIGPVSNASEADVYQWLHAELAALRAEKKEALDDLHDRDGEYETLKAENTRLRGLLDDMLRDYETVCSTHKAVQMKSAENARDTLRADNAKLRGLLRGGATLIAQERQRQVSAEGWDAGHDDEHDEGEMAQAAACYCLQSDRNWPWNLEWWKPCPQNRIKELTKAGALVAAEIDRLNRAELKEERK